MAITRVKTQITWPTAQPSILVSSATVVESEVMTIDASCVLFGIQVAASNGGTPATGDIAKIFIAWSTGDVLNNTGNDYDTQQHSQLIAVLNTFPTDTPGENPASKTIYIVPPTTEFKIYAECPAAAVNNITVYARMDEQRVA